jgi:hypothetical protein
VVEKWDIKADCWWGTGSVVWLVLLALWLKASAKNLLRTLVSIVTVLVVSRDIYLDIYYPLSIVYCQSLETYVSVVYC